MHTLYTLHLFKKEKIFENWNIFQDYRGDLIYRFSYSIMMKLEKHFWSTHIINNLCNPIISNVYSYTLIPTITSLFLEGRKHDVGVHSRFVSNCIIQWVTARVIAVLGRVDSVIPPQLVLPLTVEPSKPRLCHDEWYLNLWICDLPFRLDHLCDLPRYVLPGPFQTTCDDKSGYQHVLLHPLSQTYFGFQWHGFFFVFHTLPFGLKDWRLSEDLSHVLGNHFSSEFKHVTPAKFTLHMPIWPFS